MTEKKSLNRISMESVSLREIGGSGISVFNNDLLAMAINGSPTRGNFLRPGEIYHIEEPRIVLITEGEADISIDLEDFHIVRGTVIMTRPDVIMEVKKFSSDATVVGIVFREDIVVDDTIVSRVSDEDFQRLLRMAYLMWDLSNMQPFPRGSVVSMAQSMSAYATYLGKQTDSDVTAQKPSRQQQIFRRFKLLVNAHCNSERTVAFYADQLWISPHHLSAVIGKTSGRSVMYWINRAVILKAKVMLKTGMMAYEVAEALSFPNPAAFSRFFKRETGQTPGEYQTSCK